MKRPIYLDYNATTPLDPEVLQAMKPYLETEFGNASSTTHSYGWAAQAAVTKARQQVAQKIGAHPKSIFWTSGATESNNIALIGFIRPFVDQKEKIHILTSKVEHKAVLEVCQWISHHWPVEVDFLDVNKYGQVEIDTLKEAIRPHTKLVSIMSANNEIGSINPIQRIGELTHSHGIAFHTDAAQAMGNIHIDVEDMNIDLLSISGHKIYGPKGVGALYVRQKPQKIHLKPLMFGGTQEEGLRPGTLNTPGIVGLGKACELCHIHMDEETQRLSQLRNQLITSVLQGIPTSYLNGHPKERLSNNASFSFASLSSDIFALGLKGLACSSGSACSEGATHPSHVLKAIGHDDSLARATIRIGIGRFTSPEETKIATQKILAMAKENQDRSIF